MKLVPLGVRSIEDGIRHNNCGLVAREASCVAPEPLLIAKNDTDIVGLGGHLKLVPLPLPFDLEAVHRKFSCDALIDHLVTKQRRGNEQYDTENDKNKHTVTHCFQ
jgi:hypothetical protein